MLKGPTTHNTQTNLRPGSAPASRTRTAFPAQVAGKGKHKNKPRNFTSCMQRVNGDRVCHFACIHITAACRHSCQTPDCRSLLHSQIRQDLDCSLPSVMTAAVKIMARNGLVSLHWYDCQVVVQRKQPGESTWPRLFGCAPADTHVGEDIAQIDCRHLFARLLHRCAAPDQSPAIRSIEICECVSDALMRCIAGGIHLEKFDSLFLDARKHWANTPERHLLVHSGFAPRRHARVGCGNPDNPSRDVLPGPTA